MKTRREFLQATGGLAAAASLVAAFPARAQAYPARPISLIVPVGPGSGADIVARMLALSLGAQLAQSVVVENRPGAGGIGAIKSAAIATADGHTLVLIGSGNALTQSLFKSRPYDVLKDLVPVSRFAQTDIAVLLGKSSKYRSLQELLRAAKERPGKLSIGIPMLGTGQHLTAELLKEGGNLEFTIVPYKISGNLHAALVAGEIDAAVDLVPPALGLIRSGDMKAVAVASGSRSPVLPDVPTLREQGVTKHEFTTTMQIAAPAGTPESVVARLNAEIQKALARPELQKQYQQLGFSTVGGTPAQAREHFATELATCRELIARARIELQ